MSTLVMSADYEMLMSRSPPIYSHSPPAGFLIDYCNTTALATRNKPKPPRIIHANSPLSVTKQTFSFPKATTTTTTTTMRAPLLTVVRSKSCSQINEKNNENNNKTNKESLSVQSPRRSCLVVRSPSLSSNEKESTITDTNKNKDNENNKNNENKSNRSKKKVVFADDKGMPLAQVRVMTEPSNVPPLWSLRFLSQVTKGISAEPLPEPWEIMFPQPASDYISFRRKLDTENVSLENVIVRESEAIVLGTVKVKNIAYKKEVFVRSTSNNWETQEDTYCTFVENPTTAISGAIYVLYDTFSFKLTLPPKSRRIEFCICFRCEDKEYWDNNNNNNYVLIKKAQISPTFQKSLSADELLKQNNENNKENGKTTVKYTDITQARMDDWSEFASWTHLDTQGPYW